MGHNRPIKVFNRPYQLAVVTKPLLLQNENWDMIVASEWCWVNEVRIS
jgi:hypothetical protein